MHFQPARAASLSESFESWSPVRRFGRARRTHPNDPDNAGAGPGLQDRVADKAV